jgi:hypothetical protein
MAIKYKQTARTLFFRIAPFAIPWKKLPPTGQGNRLVALQELGGQI